MRKELSRAKLLSQLQDNHFIDLRLNRLIQIQKKKKIEISLDYVEELNKSPSKPKNSNKVRVGREEEELKESKTKEKAIREEFQKPYLT